MKEMDEFQQARAPYRPVDDFSRGASPLLTANHVVKNLAKNPFVYCAVILLSAVLVVTHFVDISPQQKMLTGLVHSPLTDSRKVAIDLFSSLDEQCMTMGRPDNGDGSCLGPPYIYVTFHGSNKPQKKNYLKKEHQVCKFTRNGCGLGAVLMPSNDGYFMNASRGIYNHPKTRELYVVDSYRKASRIRVYSDCNEGLYGRREPLRDFTFGGGNDPALIHPYSLITNPRNDDVYVTTQGTYSILKYSADGKEGKRSEYLNQKLKDCADGTVDYNIGCTSVHIPDQALYSRLSGPDYNSKMMNELKRKEISYYNFPNSFAILPFGEVRGVALDRNDFVYLGVEFGGLKQFDQNGLLLKTITKLDDGTAISPVSVFYDENTHSIWAGCKNNNILMEFNPEDLVLKRKISFSNKVRHPTGLHLIKDEIFFVSMMTNEVHKVNITNPVLDSKGRYKSVVVIPNLIDHGEFIAASDC